jgi:hypothetical protein
MKVLCACEESQAVCIAFGNNGHEAYSCDIESCSGGYPEWHIQGDVIPLLTEAAWDIVIAFPPPALICAFPAPDILQKNGPTEGSNKQ